MLNLRWLCRASAATITVFLFLTALPLVAQDDTSGGKLKSKVLDVLTAIADGSCPPKLLNPVLLDQCEAQLEKMHSVLKSMGPIKEVLFRGTEQMPNGVEVEVYRVTFANGRMTWTAAAGPNGKLTVLWTPG